VFVPLVIIIPFPDSTEVGHLTFSSVSLRSYTGCVSAHGVEWRII